MTILPDADLDETSSGTGITPPAIDAAATKKNLSIYPELQFTTERVAFNYAIFNEFISEMDSNYGVRATDIYLTYGAYTEDDTRRYLENHSNATDPIDFDDIIKKPCLLLSYNIPDTDQFAYIDFGALCPPPNSCNSKIETGTMTLREFVTRDQSDFDPEATILNYTELYDNARRLDLTQMVKFNIADVNNLVTRLDAQLRNTTTDIYFVMGAYTVADAERYVTVHTQYRKEEIQTKTCLLFAYYYPNPDTEDKFMYFDFGVLCPPDK